MKLSSRPSQERGESRAATNVIPTLFYRWFEQDPEEIVASVRSCISNVGVSLGSHDLSCLKGIGVTNQRETTVLWDKVSGRSLAPAIVWSDGRTGNLVDRMVAMTPTKNKDHFRVRLIV